MEALLPPLRLGKEPSSGSRGVGSGDGKWRLLRSGSEPPVLSAGGRRGALLLCSGDGKMLGGGGRGSGRGAGGIH